MKEIISAWKSWNKPLNLKVCNKATRLCMQYDKTKSEKDRKVAEKYISAHINEIPMKDEIIMQGILKDFKDFFYCNGNLKEFTFKVPKE